MSLAHVNVDEDAVLKTLGLNPRDPSTQALLLICQRYGLDPLLKHIVLIQGRPYVTRDGYLHIAHSSGKFDGIEIVDEGETPTHWWAKAAVWRKDMKRPFAYRGRYPKRGGNSAYGPEMAVKCAEVMALRRAFCVTGVGAADERWDDPDGRISPQVASALAERLNTLGKEARQAFLARFGRRPSDLTAEEEGDAIEFVDQLEAEVSEPADDAAGGEDEEVVEGEVVDGPPAEEGMV